VLHAKEWSLFSVLSNALRSPPLLPDPPAPWFGSPCCCSDDVVDDDRGEGDGAVARAQQVDTSLGPHGVSEQSVVFAAAIKPPE
jgi:hypothetical protein